MALLTEIIKISSLILFGFAFFLIMHYLLRETGIIGLPVGTGAEPVGQLKNNSEMPSCALFQKIFWFVILTRLAIYLIGYMGVMLFHDKTGFISWFEPIWNKWDAGHYLFIAQNWYVTVTDKKYLIVFYPLYPVLIKLVQLLVRNYFWAAILVSNAALVVASIYFYKLVNIDYESKIAFNSVKFMLLAPFSFFYAVPYSDSLFLAFSVMTFYYMRKEKWWSAGITGMLAALTRNFGVLLLLPVVIEFLIAHDLIFKLKQKQYGAVFAIIRKFGLALLLIPLGLGVYLIVNKSVTGNWFTFLIYQKEYWHQEFGFFAENLKN